MGIVRTVYETAGLEMTERAHHQLTSYREEHPRGKEGRVTYDLRADFGVTPTDVRRPFAFYFDAFPSVRIEAT